jgi:dipeptidyl aminopeptidase/acylaminoacyl peptidase
MRIVHISLAAILLSQPLMAAKQPVTHEAIWLMKRVGAPAISPDGRWVVAPVTEPAYDEKESSTDLWLMASDGSKAPRRLTFSKASESDVTWAPDSGRIAFSAKRDGDEANQVYLLDIARGGEARRITSLSTGARSPHFSADGQSIIFSSVVYPHAADDEANRKAAKEVKDRKYNVRIYDSFPVRNWDRWLDEKEPHIIVQAIGEGSKSRDLLAGTKLVAQPGFGGRTTEGSREEIDAEWTPDGKEVVFTATTGRNSAARAEVDVDLFRVSANGAEPEQLTDDPGGYSNPEFSPDGKTLYVAFTPNTGKVYNLNRIVAFDWPSMKNRRVITATTDRSVNTYAVTPDGKSILFTAEDSGLEKVYSVAAAGGDTKLAINPDRGVYTDLEIGGDAKSPVLIGRWASSVNPAEVVRIDLGSKTHTNLTSFAVDQAANLDWQPPRHVWFTNSRGRKVHSLMILPPGFDPAKKYPLFVMIHGGPASMSRDQISLRWNYHLLAQPGYVLLAPNYTGSTGFGEAFAQAIQGDPLRGPGLDINEAADAAIQQFPFIDATKQVAGGASYGGHLANWLQATTTRYKALISHAGLVNLESQWGTSDTIYGRELMNMGPVWEQGSVWKEQNPIRYANNFKTPMLISVGEHDYRVPLNQSLENWAVHQRLQVPSRLLVWPDENHWILNAENSKVFYREVASWLAKWLDK